VSCPYCVDESVSVGRVAMDDPFMLMVAEAAQEEYMEHLRVQHPAEWAREKKQRDELDAALRNIFGKGQT
jgi:hypothetical protein